jgi:3-methyl-2-oxobutanoate hydroxymethyltransferase
VSHDVLGLFDRFTPRFVRRYANLHAEMAQAFRSFREDVENTAFPGPEHTVEMDADEWDALIEELGD